MAKKMKKMLEVSLVSAELTSLPERKLLKSRNLVCVDMIWPRAGIARKSAAREATFRKGKVDFSTEEWAKRVVFREDVEARTAFAVSITEPVTVQKLKRFARLTAKYALRMGPILWRRRWWDMRTSLPLLWMPSPQWSVKRTPLRR